MMTAFVPTGAPNAGRRLIVEVRWGVSAGTKAVVEPGRVLQVGRAEAAGLSVPGDASMSEAHFELAWDGARCLLRDLRSGTGTLLGGQRVEEGQVPHGGWVRAGMTDFSVYVEELTPPHEPAVTALPSRMQFMTGALKVLASQSAPLFAVLDAARDERILVLMRESVEQYRSLYEGPQGETLAEVAPYLVGLPRDSRLLEVLVQEGWGMSWGLFLTSRRTLNEVRRHLRKFLLVQDATGRELYFRFYDPRVLSVFLPRCAAGQLQELFEGVESFLMEGPEGERLLRFSMRARRVHQEEVSLGSV